MQVEKTVFISYRRTNVYIAQAVYSNLMEYGYDVFLDFESIDAGSFLRIILNQIAARAHFILILTPSALNGCTNPDDFIRREIEHAIEHKRNIVPLMFENFDFGDVRSYLSGQLALLPEYNGIRMPADFFKEAMSRLRDRFLSKPLDIILHPLPVGMSTEKQSDEKPAPQMEQLQAEEVFERGFTEYCRGSLEKAVTYYNDAIRLNPEFAEAYYQRGLVYGIKRQWESTRRDFQRSLELASEGPKAKVVRSWLHFMDKDLQKALVEAEESLKQNSYDYEGLRLRATLYMAAGKYDQSVNDFTEAIKIDPAPYITYHDRASARLMKGDIDGAIEDYTQAITINPEAFPPYHDRGATLLKKGDLRGAIEDLTRAIEIEPQSAMSYYNRGEARFRSGDLDGAVADFQTTLRIYPQFGQARTRLNMVRLKKGADWIGSLFRGS
jgi:tetratricopeptide (TPR) repeat protein